METNQSKTMSGSLHDRWLRFTLRSRGPMFVLLTASLIFAASGYCADERYYDQASLQTLSVPDSTIGTTYYIDGRDGNDSWNGRSPVYTSGITGPFKSIGYATGPYSGRLIGGNVFKIKAGVYRERLEFRNATGNTDESRRIVIGPYGDGEVVLDPTESSSLVWSVYTGNANIYVTNCDLLLGKWPVPPNAVIMDDNFRSCRPVYRLSDVNSFGKWFYDSTAKKLYVYTGGATPSSHGIIVTSLDENNTNFGITVWGADYLTIYGLTIAGASSYAIDSTSMATQVEQCTLKYSGKGAFKAYGGSPKLIKSHVYGNVMMNWPRGRTWNYTGGWPAAVAFSNSTNGLASGNIIHDNGGEGFITGGGNGNGIIEDNIAYNNWSVNLYIETQGNSIMRRNLTYVASVNESDIVSSDDPTIPTWISWNELYKKILRRLYSSCLVTSDESNSDPNSARNKIYNNIAIGCYAGIQHVPEAPGSAMKNYLIANNTVIMPVGVPPAGYTWVGIDLPFSGGSNIGTVVKNNIIVNTRPESFMIFLGGGVNENGITLDNNLYYNANYPTQFTAYDYPNNRNYDLGTWKATMVRQDVNSRFLNPQFTGGTDPLSPSYYIPTANSPAIGMGADLQDIATDFNRFLKTTPKTSGALDYGSVSSPRAPTGLNVKQ